MEGPEGHRLYGTAKNRTAQIKHKMRSRSFSRHGSLSGACMTKVTKTAGRRCKLKFVRSLLEAVVMKRSSARTMQARHLYSYDDSHSHMRPGPLVQNLEKN